MSKKTHTEQLLDEAALIIAGLSTRSDDLPTFCVIVQESATGLHSLRWPCDCAIIGIISAISSQLIISRDGTSSTPENVLAGANGGVIIRIEIAAAVMGLHVPMKEGENLWIYNASSMPVTFVCRRQPASQGQ